MKLTNADWRLPGETPRVSGRGRAAGTRHSGFTMIEIALCLAIIGFALVSILLVLPSGMNTQRETREETIIGQDASMLLEAIRSGARGMDDLTNYVYAITNYTQIYDNNGKQVGGQGIVCGYTYSAAIIGSVPDPAMVITNGLRIIGLLSTPEFTPAYNNGGVWAESDGPALASTFGRLYTSNHVVAYVRSFSGLAAEKPPQNNQIMQEDTFTYRVLCVNAPAATDTNAFNNSPLPSYTRDLAANVRELRLLFMWPQLPNGNVGGFRQTYRESIAGQLVTTNYAAIFPGISDLSFYQPQSFSTNAP